MRAAGESLAKTGRSEEKRRLSEKAPRGYGVIFREKQRDLKHLVHNFTAPALAAALRDREDTLHVCASLLEAKKVDELRKVLAPFRTSNVHHRRKKKRDMLLGEGFKEEHIYMLRKYLHRLPRQLPRYAVKRASVLLPLCNENGVPCVLFQKRSSKVRSHKSQVCFPGGMVDDKLDANVVETCLREMEEEMGVGNVKDILGVLRCDWGVINKLVGVSVTPVVGWMGDIEDYDLSNMNPDEVESAFTVPISDLLRRENWVVTTHDHDRDVPYIAFDGGPHRVWGLTAYVLDLFLQDVLLRYRVQFEKGGATPKRPLLGRAAYYGGDGVYADDVSDELHDDYFANDD